MEITSPRPFGAGTGARRLPWSGRALAGSLALASCYLYRTGWVVWPHLLRDGGDFEGYYRAAGEILAGRSPFLDRFDYPPLAALLALPLHPLGLGGARVAWFLLSQLCLLGAAHALYRALGGDRRAGWTVAALWGLAGALPENLAIGQVQPLLLFLVCLAWRWDAERPTWAAGAIGLAAGIKLWPGALLAAYLPKERRRDLGAGTAAFTSGATATLALIPGLVHAAVLHIRADLVELGLQELLLVRREHRPHLRLGVGGLGHGGAHLLHPRAHRLALVLVRGRLHRAIAALPAHLVAERLHLRTEAIGEGLDLLILLTAEAQVGGRRVLLERVDHRNVLGHGDSAVGHPSLLLLDGRAVKALIPHRRAVVRRVGPAKRGWLGVARGRLRHRRTGDEQECKDACCPNVHGPRS